MFYDIFYAHPEDSIIRLDQRLHFSLLRKIEGNILQGKKVIPECLPSSESICHPSLNSTQTYLKIAVSIYK